MFAELDITSNFTFLTGGSHPEEYAERAALLGLPAFAIADENSVAGLVRAHAQLAEIARDVHARASVEAAAGPIGPRPPWSAPQVPDGRYPGLADTVPRRDWTPPAPAAAPPAGPIGPRPARHVPASPGEAGGDPPRPTQEPTDGESGRPTLAGRSRGAAVAGPVAAFETRTRPPVETSPDITCVPRLIPGARLVTMDGLAVTALPRDRAAWGRLCRLITLGRRRAEKGACRLVTEDLLDWCEGFELLLHPPEERDAGKPAAGALRHATAPSPTEAVPVPPAARRNRLAGEASGRSPAETAKSGTELSLQDPFPELGTLGSTAAAGPGAANPERPENRTNPAAPLDPADAAPTPPPRGPEGWRQRAERLVRRFPADVSLVLAPRYDGQDRARFDRLARLARRLGVPTVASAAPVMHHGGRRMLTDVLTAIRTGARVDDLGRAALANAERRLRSEGEMRRLLAGHEDAVDRAGAVAGRCTFSLDELRYEYPSEISGNETPAERLRRLAHEGLAWRYPSGAPEKVRATMEHELRLIAKLGYEPYFLTVHDVVAFARSRDILCQGRGSAANSVVCYALGVTSVSPEIGTMVFERFVSEARNEPPDIDVDFEHERREEVIQHIYERYGRHRAGICATVIHYRGKRALREVGKAMGLTDDTIGALSSQLWGFFSAEGLEDQRLREIGLDPADRRLRQTLDLVREIQGFPRHLSQHVGGFVITEGRLDELVPVENASMEDRTVICWDKDDIDALGILKVDVLALGMLTCIRKAFDLIARHHQVDYTLATLPPEDPIVYDMLCKADTIGVFQVESRAQMSFLPRMRPRCFYDLVIEVAIIRPGPIQGDMLHPYLRRRCGQEAVDFPSDELGAVLGKTLGVPLFQEQAMQIAIIGAGFSPEEADRLRRALATFKKVDKVTPMKGRFLAGMRERGYDMDFAERCFAQIEGFGSYGFPESHAASFALLVYASSWLKRHHPGIFACALLNAQPMGFYAPAQIVRDAREHGVEVRPVCINQSYWDCTMEPDGHGGLAIRLGFRQIRAMREEEAHWTAGARGNGYQSVEDVWRRAGTSPRILRVLAEADAFADLGLSRRQALWEARAIASERPLPLFSGDMDGEGIVEDPANLPPMTLGEEVVEDYVATRLTLRAHPMTLLRHILTPGTPPLVPPAEGDPAGGADWKPMAHEVRGPGTVMGSSPTARHPRDVDTFGGRRFADARGTVRSEWWGADPAQDGKLGCTSTRD